MPQQNITVELQEYQGAINNPLKGIRPYLWSDESNATNPKPGPFAHEYGALRRQYIKWNVIEACESDGADKIIDYCNRVWQNVEKHNVKIIPRVYLVWSASEVATPLHTFWPEDMVPFDWTSEKFLDRMVKMIGKLGQAWDNDPRVAYVETGIYGAWGEQHNPFFTPEIRDIFMKAFKDSFKHKICMVRKGPDCKGRGFGIYWDSFAHWDEKQHALGILANGDDWKDYAIGGECAYDWGNWKIQAGTTPDDSLTDFYHLHYILGRVRALHANHLGWIDQYDQTSEASRKGAAELQKALGYRLVLKNATFPARVEPGEAFYVDFTVLNTGSSPLYYHWPVALSLLDPETRQPVYQEKFAGIDSSSWLPGENWCFITDSYLIPARENLVHGRFVLPESVPAGEYIFALSLLDPCCELPCARFAVQNYWNGGQHPIGKTGVATDVADHTVGGFDDVAADKSLYYTL